MSMNGELTGFGPYSKAVAQHLDYPPDHYGGGPDGYRTTITLFPCDTSTSSRDQPRQLEPMRVNSAPTISTT